MSPWARNTALRGLFCGLFVIGLAACAPAEIDSDPQLVSLAERIGAAEAQRRPEAAETMGLPDALFGGRYNDRLDARDIASVERNRTSRLEYLAALEAIDPATLSPDQRRVRASLSWMLDAVTALDAQGYGQAELGRASPYVISFADGAYTDLVKFMTLHAPVRTRSDAADWLKRLEGLDDALRNDRRRFEVDIDAGAAPPASILRRTLEKAQQLAPVNPREHVLVTYFVESLAQIPDISEADISALVKQATDLVGGEIKTEYGRLIDLLKQTLATASEDSGVWRLKDGEAYYAKALRLHTTTELSAKQLNEAGVKLVADISAEIEPLLVEMGMAGEGAVGARLHQLAVDPAYLLPDTPEGRVALLAQITDRIAWAQKDMAAVLPGQPKAAVDVREAARVTQDSASGAFYKAAALDGSRPAIFNLNLRSTLDFPTWSLPTLAFHEAVPGHHIQAGLARERAGQLTISYFMGAPAFSEGWATYAEDLAAERGAYKDDPLGRIGYLQAMLLRAARLVADTGMHAQKWPRAQAIDYLERTVGVTRAEAEIEVDRMTIWPGLACSYMAGRETIRRLRTGAQRELKTAFDLKAFHEAILAPGARPLPVLEADIDEWIISRKPALPAE
jgi:uncharacterized protein (DUF885 family)